VKILDPTGTRIPTPPSSSPQPVAILMVDISRKEKYLKDIINELATHSKKMNILETHTEE
jgi:hypothetical protein